MSVNIIEAFRTGKKVRRVGYEGVYDTTCDYHNISRDGVLSEWEVALEDTEFTISWESFDGKLFCLTGDEKSVTRLKGSFIHTALIYGKTTGKEYKLATSTTLVLV
jgi:hypothetical protein